MLRSSSSRDFNRILAVVASDRPDDALTSVATMRRYVYCPEVCFLTNTVVVLMNVPLQLSRVSKCFRTENADAYSIDMRDVETSVTKKE